MSRPEPALEARGVSRRFGAVRALQEASLAVHPGEILAVLGPSGSGKSTLLRVLAGLEQVDAGSVLEAGREVSRPGRADPAEKRQVGLVFQDYALFPHLDATANVAFGLTGMDRRAAQERARGWLARVGLAHRAGAWPHQLSGGEQQRVALARALAPEPAAILLDEPFSGLDPALRSEVQEATVRTLKAAGKAALVVSHDTEEALALADTVAVMEAGRVAQCGTPDAVHARPLSLAVARALGPVWTWGGEARAGRLETPFGVFATPGDGRMTLAARPESTGLQADPDGTLVVTSVRGVGTRRRVALEGPAGLLVAAEIAVADAPRPGDRASVLLSAPCAMIFPG